MGLRSPAVLDLTLRAGTTFGASDTPTSRVVDEHDIASDWRSALRECEASHVASAIVTA